MSNNGSNARPWRTLMRRVAWPLVLAAAACAASAGPAGAHGGDTQLVHSCIAGDGNVKIVAADATCGKNELPLDWPSSAAGTTYTAGSGLSLSPTNEFSVTGAPWSGLTGMPAGFADGVDDVGTAPTWNTLGGVPADLRDGDDDGSAKVGELRGDLSQDDGTPNEDGDPVSFSKIKDLTTMSGDGRITGGFIRDGSIEGQDIGDGTITARDLAGSDAPEGIVVGAVTSEKIADGTIQARDLASGVINRAVETVVVDPGPVEAGQRTHVTVAAGVAVADLVTVSPPHSLETGLVFAGSAVRDDGSLTIYLHNASFGLIDGDSRTWTVNRIRVP